MITNSLNINDKVYYKPSGKIGIVAGCMWSEKTNSVHYLVKWTKNANGTVLKRRTWGLSIHLRKLPE